MIREDGSHHLTTRSDLVGLIRKSLAVGSLGLVRGSSKKQRVAKAQLREMRKQTSLLKEDVEREAREQAALQRSRVLPQVVRQQAALPPAPMTPPPPGWFPAPERADLLRWWDGERWTDQTAPRG
jgi:hypothetical protein